MVAMHYKFAATAQREPIHGGNGRDMEYLRSCEACWNCATMASTSASFPAIKASATFRLRAALSTADWAVFLSFFASRLKAEGGSSLFSRSVAFCKFGSRRKRRLCLPDHQCTPVSLGFIDGLLDSVQHIAADGVHLALEAENGYTVIAAVSLFVCHIRTASVSNMVSPYCTSRSATGRETVGAGKQATPNVGERYWWTAQKNLANDAHPERRD